MLLYHGSPNEFKKFKVNMELCKRDVDSLAEGLGIYLTEDKNVAKSYGKYLYTVEVKDEALLNMADWRDIKYAVARMSTSCVSMAFDFGDYISKKDINSIVEGVLSGDISCTDLPREITLIMDSCEKFHEDYNDMEIVFEMLNETNQELLENYVFKYNDRSLGAVFIAKNPTLLKIVNVEGTGE